MEPWLQPDDPVAISGMSKPVFQVSLTPALGDRAMPRGRTGDNVNVGYRIKLGHEDIVSRAPQDS